MAHLVVVPATEHTERQVQAGNDGRPRENHFHGGPARFARPLREHSLHGAVDTEGALRPHRGGLHHGEAPPPAPAAVNGDDACRGGVPPLPHVVQGVAGRRSFLAVTSCEAAAGWEVSVESESY